MKKRLLTKLILSVFLFFTIVSCQEEKPEILLPDTNISVVLLSDMRQTVNQGDSLTIKVKTYPADLLENKHVSFQIIGADSTEYKYIRFSSMEKQSDGSWNLNFQLLRGVKFGDRIMLKVNVEKEDLILYTKEITLNYIKEPKGIETLESDYIFFDEGDTAKIHVFLKPWDLPTRKDVSISVYTAADSLYRYAKVLDPTMLEDSTWYFNLQPQFGMQDGDTVRVCIQDQDTALFTIPLPLYQNVKAHETTRSVQIVSDEISAYYTGALATIRFRTTPWDLLLDDSVRFQMTDTLGNELLIANVRKPEFQADSTWAVQLDLKSALTDAYVKVGVVTSDSTYLSETVNVKKVTFNMSSVTDDYRLSFTLDSKTMTYSRLLPTSTDFNNIILIFKHNGDKLTVGDKVIENNTDTFDLRKPVTVSVWKYDAHKDYQVVMKNTGLPIVRITTPNRQAINSKDVWVANSRIEVVYPDGTVDLKDTLSVRCRGNASFKDTNKKSYALKIDEKQNILGMHKNKRWILLANFKDRTLLRNDVTFWLAKKTCQDYVVSGQFVELVVNGDYRGNYYFCEQGKIGKHRININDPDPANPGTSGFLIESDAYYSEEPHATYGGFISNTLKIPYAMKQPDETEMTYAALEKVKKFINDFEACLKSETRVKNHEYEKYIDVDQCIDYALIQELTGNLDFYNDYPVPGAHSMYFHIDNIDNGGKLVFGHLWDFDYKTYEPSRATIGWVAMKKHGSQTVWNYGGSRTLSSEFYYYYLLKDSKFKNRMVERWNLLKDDFALAPDYIDMMADSIRVSENCNATMPNNGDGGKGWVPIVSKNGGGTNDDINMSFQGAINQMKKGFTDRWNWIDKNIKSL